MKKIFTFILSLGMAGAVSAQTISQESASQTAANIFAKTAKVSEVKSLVAGSTVSAAPQLAYVSEKNGVTCFYVFNNPQGGYAIVGGDLVARKVLAVVDNGSFDINTTPAPVKYMLSQYEQDICAAKAMKAKASTSGTAAYGDDVDALITTQWNQGLPYNMYAPVITKENTKGFDCPDSIIGTKCATGCVATATAQAMNYLIQVNSMSGRHGGTFKHDLVNEQPDGTDKIVGSCQTSSTFNTYNASLLNKTTFDKDTTTAAAREVGRLMIDAGNVCMLQYGPSTGGSEENVKSGLVNYIGIPAKLQYRNDMSDAQWEKLCYKEISAERPLIYCGASSGGGHCFIVDGYQYDSTNKAHTFHVNWGWGGLSDGYYALSGSNALDPENQGIGGSNPEAKESHYRNENSIVYNLIYDADNLAKEEPSFFSTGMSVSTTDDDNSSEAKAMVAENESNIITCNFDKKQKLVFTFDGEGAVNQGVEDADIILGLELAPYFEDGQEPDEYDVWAVPVDDMPSQKYAVGAGIQSYTYDAYQDFNPAASAANGNDDYIPAGIYRVRPITYYDDDDDEGTEITDDDPWNYITMPKTWKAPLINFVGTQTSTAINTIDANASKLSAKAYKKIIKRHIVIEKDGKQYNAAGARL